MKKQGLCHGLQGHVDDFFHSQETWGFLRVLSLLRLYPNTREKAQTEKEIASCLSKQLTAVTNLSNNNSYFSTHHTVVLYKYFSYLLPFSVK